MRPKIRIAKTGEKQTMAVGGLETGSKHAAAIAAEALAQALGKTPQRHRDTEKS